MTSNSCCAASLCAASLLPCWLDETSLAAVEVISLRNTPMKIVLMFVMAAAAASPAAAQWKNLPAPPNLAAPTPRAANGKPDLSGVWQADGQTYFFDLAVG